ERRLEYQVVDGHERDLGCQVAGIGEETFVSRDELVVEDRPEGGRDLLAGALDVRGNPSGLRYDLVLEARVELHVSGLVDLLGGEKGHLLLTAVGSHQP